MNETRQNTEKRFSESVSENKKKRERHTVYKRDHMAKLTVLGVISISKWYPLKMRG